MPDANLEPTRGTGFRNLLPFKPYRISRFQRSAGELLQGFLHHTLDHGTAGPDDEEGETAHIADTVDKSFDNSGSVIPMRHSFSPGTVAFDVAHGSSPSGSSNLASVSLNFTSGSCNLAAGLFN